MKSLLVFIICCFISCKSLATNLRGQVVRFNPNTKTYFPLAGIRVDLWVYNGSQWIDLSFAVTGNDGFYYFINVQPGLLFRMQVLGNFFPPQPLNVALIYPPYYQDIPVIIS